MLAILEERNGGEGTEAGLRKSGGRRRRSNAWSRIARMEGEKGSRRQTGTRDRNRCKQKV